MADFGYRILKTVDDEIEIIGKSWDVEEARQLMNEAACRLMEDIPDSKKNEIDYDKVEVIDSDDSTVAEYEVKEFEQR